MKRNERIGSYSLPDDSPRIITSIVYQKKDKLRASVSIDGVFAFGINSTTVEHFRFRKGDELTSTLFEEIKTFDERASAKRIASKYLNSRRRSEREVTSKLRAEGFDNRVIQETVSALKDYGLINDEELAKAFIHDKLLTKASSKRELGQLLQKKGISKSIIAEVIDDTGESGDEESRAMQTAKKKWTSILRRESDPRKRRQKLYAFLASRGFDGSTTRIVVAKFTTDEKEDFEE